MLSKPGDDNLELYPADRHRQREPFKLLLRSFEAIAVHLQEKTRDVIAVLLLPSMKGWFFTRDSISAAALWNMSG
jgi:hypothetical protein